MDYAVIGGDARFACLTRLLCSAGKDARLIEGVDCSFRVPRAKVESVEDAQGIIMNWPNRYAEEVLMRAKPGANVYFCGPVNPKETPVDLKCVDLWKDEQLQLENAWLTAEGAISAVMNRANRAVKDCRCLVIGWGRIGRALTELLIGLGAEVTVASRSEKGRNGAIERGAQSISTYNMKEALRGKDVVFSTPPERILGEEALTCAEKDALIVDLASAPYGVDLEAAERLNLQAWREPGLPGRYCPFSAACALLAAIRRVEEEVFA